MTIYGPPCDPAVVAHHRWVTEAEYLLGVEFDREVPVGGAVADAAFVKDGEAHWVEVDNSQKLTRKQYRDKWDGHARTPGYILVICHTASRMRRLMAWSEAVRDKALFTTFRRLAFRNCRRVWVDCDGRRTEL